jgi:putative transcriptional regulator
MPLEESFGDDFDAEPHKQRLKQGCILVARDSLNDPNFDSAVVLVCRYGPEGAYGLVLNHPAHMPLTELFDHPPHTAQSFGKTRRVYIGGPVQPAELQILQVGLESAPGSLEISRGVHLGGAWTELEDFLSWNPKNLRLFLGYSGWGAGQLERELELGAWEVYQTDLSKLLLGPEEPWFAGSDDFKRFLDSI